MAVQRVGWIGCSDTLDKGKERTLDGRARGGEAQPVSATARKSLNQN